MRIYLTGYMGSGKSYIGRNLAKRLHFGFLDLDDYIEARAGAKISQIFAKKGEASFRQLERERLLETQFCHRYIISTGGGTACFFDNMDWINSMGWSIFLDTAIPLILERLLRKKAHRPLIANLSDHEILAFITKKLEERRPFYEKANIVLTKTHEEEDVLSELTKYCQLRLFL